MGKRNIPIIGREDEALTEWKRHFRYKPGERKRLKRNFGKRSRKFAKREAWLAALRRDTITASKQPCNQLPTPGAMLGWVWRINHE